MGTLRDKVYEDLDYLSQLTEIVVSPQNELLGKLPDKLELNFETIKRLKTRSWAYVPGYELSMQAVLTSLIQNSHDCRVIEDILPHFQFEVSDDFELDFSNDVMVGTIQLIKVNTQIEEKKLLEMAVQKAVYELSYYSWQGKQTRERLITIINLLEPGRGTKWAQNTTGKLSYVGCTEIQTILTDLILENKWRVRDASIIIKIGKWINAYLSRGDEVSLMNLLKLKIMVDKDLPIYSVDEVKNVNPT